MDSEDQEVRLVVAEERLKRAWLRLMHLRDSEQCDYEVEDLYRLALREYRAAEEALMAARDAADRATVVAA